MPTHYSRISQLDAPYRHIYLSPHLDDAALSCGGGIARLIADEHPVLVVNICTGSPDPAAPLSAFAAATHARWGLSSDAVLRQRLHEDIAALETLGADSYQLDFLDAIYRMPAAYVSNATLFGAPAPDDPLEQALRAALAPLQQRYPDAILYAPLGVGNHVDHQIAHAAARAFASTGTTVAFYEDLPYSMAHGALHQRIEQLGGATLLMPVVTAIDSVLPRKISAIEAYASQLGSLFGDAAAMAAQVRAYAESLRPEQGTYGERLWMRR